MAVAIGRGYNKNHSTAKFHNTFTYQIQNDEFQPEIEAEIC